MRVLIMQEVSPAGLVELEGHELVRGNDPSGCDGVVCYLIDRIDEAFLATPGLRGLATVSVGLDHIDLAAAERHRIPIAYTPDVLTEATADLTFALLLGAARRLGESERYLRAGRWQSWSFDLLLGTDVHGKTLGIIGPGRIGRAVARRADGFGMRVLFAGRDRAELERVLAESDFVAVTVPLSDSTRHLIGAAELARMKQGAFLINTSRGPVVDEAALAESLASGHLGGAGLDVFENEPHVHPALLACESALMVPHIASATRETRDGMARLACRGLAQILRGERPPNLANPQVWPVEAESR
ncbi:MAG TPA: D-glycerate dehydrogenase [Gaiellales bacterium]|jgi:glyoxylate reductase|nr:D-glycerate dehydrogenase [Gaiellales bacterium]